MMETDLYPSLPQTLERLHGNKQEQNTSKLIKPALNKSLYYWQQQLCVFIEYIFEYSSVFKGVFYELQDYF